MRNIKGIIEGNLSYMEIEDGNRVRVVTIDGLCETMDIGGLKNLVESHNFDKDVKEELEILISKVSSEWKR